MEQQPGVTGHSHASRRSHRPSKIGGSERKDGCGQRGGKWLREFPLGNLSYFPSHLLGEYLLRVERIGQDFKQEVWSGRPSFVTRSLRAERRDTEGVSDGADNKRDHGISLWPKPERVEKFTHKTSSQHWDWTLT